MPLDFLTDGQVAAYGRFDGVPSRADLERFFFLDDADRDLISDRRGDHNRLGFVLQATTVRYVGVFGEDPVDVPWQVVEYLAAQLGIEDTSCAKRYTDQTETAYEHAGRSASPRDPGVSQAGQRVDRDLERLERGPASADVLARQDQDSAIAGPAGTRLHTCGILPVRRRAAEVGRDTPTANPTRWSTRAPRGRSAPPTR